MAKEIEEKKNRRKFFAHVKTKRTAKREQTDDENSNVIEVTPGISARVKVLIVILVILIAAVVIVSVRRYINTREYQGYNVVSSVETNGDNIADYIMFSDNVLKVTKDQVYNQEQSTAILCCKIWKTPDIS